MSMAKSIYWREVESI